MFAPDTPSFLQYLLPNLACLLIPILHARKYAENRPQSRMNGALRSFLFSALFTLALGRFIWQGSLTSYLLACAVYAIFSALSFLGMAWAIEKTRKTG
jgi:drug/metabolite transporter (DMT)-like permease